uniref:CENP-V/GFA domain-containing protein n=1 Tax=Phenylobacterium glaciei TaxID=2803784 RepID=A0A974P274_9CAUL|nr:hypothetical protein JKL49_20470 [Phenylobacterium glaciei]
MTRHLGSCHCGAVTFAIEAEIDHLTACDCSLCVKKNARMVRVRADLLTVLSGRTSSAPMSGTLTGRGTISAGPAASTSSTASARRATCMRSMSFAWTASTPPACRFGPATVWACLWRRRAREAWPGPREG